MDVLAAAEHLIPLAIALAIHAVALGLLFVLPEWQRLIEQQRTQRVREAEFLRKHPRMEIEA